MKDKLPIPNAEELVRFNKIKYVDRIFNSGITRKDFGLEEIDFAKFICDTFDNFMLNNKHLTLQEFKKTLR